MQETIALQRFLAHRALRRMKSPSYDEASCAAPRAYMKASRDIVIQRFPRSSLSSTIRFFFNVL